MVNIKNDCKNCQHRVVCKFCEKYTDFRKDATVHLEGMATYYDGFIINIDCRYFKEIKEIVTR